MQEHIYFEESWNENWEGTVLDGRISSTRETEDDPKGPWRQNQVQPKNKT